MRHRPQTALRRAIWLMFKKRLGMRKLIVEPCNNEHFPSAKYKISVWLHSDTTVNEQQIIPIYEDWQLRYVGGTFMNLDDGSQFSYLVERIFIIPSKATTL